MELHAFDGMMAMPQAHDGAGAVFLGGPGADFEFGWQIFFFDDERVITRGRHRHGKSLKHCPVVMHHRAGFAVHEMSGTNHAAAEGFADGLMSQANAEDGNFSREVADEGDADSGLVRRAGARRDDDSLGLQGLHFVDGDLVVASHLNLCAQFADVLDQVVGERIVVVEYENHVGNSTVRYQITPDSFADELRG